jgi:hypothetical protein
MTAKPMLMGAEVEYSMSSPHIQTRSGRAQLHEWLLDAIRTEHRWLMDIRTPSGIYFDNGSRYYLDSGNHNEFSSPELSTPRQVAVYDRAAEQILLRAKAAVRERTKGVDICVTKNNVNFSRPDQAAWGQHESYTCWIPLEKAAAQLIPHLVSRLPYAGAGYLSAHPDGMGFELSQRARHMTRATGVETTHDRAIFCTRVRKPSDRSQAGWTRTNLISKDSQRCSFSVYLCYGVTSLLFMVMNEGHQIGRKVQLKNSVSSMRAISLDPWLQTNVPLANGRHATAIDIQREYLREITPYVESGDFPDWTAEVLHHWSTTLDQLESNPQRLSNRLDAYVKLALFEHQLSRAGLSWGELCQSLQVLEQLRCIAPEAVIRALLHETANTLCDEHKALFSQLAKMNQSKHIRLDHLRFAVRLQALELNYHELGGHFDQMAATGLLDSAGVTPEVVDWAINNPPSGGRAEARSKTIAEFHGQAWLSDWQFVVNRENEKWVDLRDPFTNKREVSSVPSTLSSRRNPLALSNLLD